MSTPTVSQGSGSGAGSGAGAGAGPSAVTAESAATDVREHDVQSLNTGATAERVITVTEAYSCRRLTTGRLLAMAAVTPYGSTNPIDVALGRSLQMNRPDIARIEVSPDHFSPATEERPYSLAQVENFMIDGTPHRLMIMRGDVRSVMSAATIARSEKYPFTRHFDLMERMGKRCLAIACATIDDDGTVGDYYLEGIIALSLLTASENIKSVSDNPKEWVRVNLWSATLRFQHWANFFLIIAMTVTGYAIMAPELLPMPASWEDTGFLMGWMRFIHFASGFSWICLGLSRVWLAFVAKDRQLRWRAFWPLNSKKDVNGLWHTIRYYLFIDKHAPVYVGHNPLQQLAYTGVYLLCLVQMFSGMSLYGLYNHYNWFWRWMSLPASWIGIPYMRLIHAVIMFLIWTFVVIHVYLAIRADTVERHGGISSMFNGGVWLRRGTKPMDSPKIG